LAQLIEQNEAYNESYISDVQSPCILCGNAYSRGILLNDKSYLCKNCFNTVATISYPEKYENVRRQYIQEKEARRIALEGFIKTFEYKKTGNNFFSYALYSLLLLLINIGFILVPIILFIISSFIEKAQNKKLEEWRAQLDKWHKYYPEPSAPLLRHFHDPLTELTSRDKKILKIFNNWPSYPPFWPYLREVVIARDNNRCQVTGCPSRLSLHIHHKIPVSKGGEHIPTNLVSLCDFHHALEPTEGHERIWSDVKTKYFTLVCEHERHNRVNNGTHNVCAHLRRLELISLKELEDLNKIYGFCCPSCGSSFLKFTLFSNQNKIEVHCKECNNNWEGPQQLTEESGPLLSETLKVTKNQGSWKPRWDMLSNRAESSFKNWKTNRVPTESKKKKTIRAKNEKAPTCPKCGSAMFLLKPRQGQQWKAFWGCSKYRSTGCRGKVNA